MKFTCENCGAQYLIADTKLGDRGVKVRCKKCSYVIILRPSGWAPDQKKEIKEDAPPIAAREAREKDAVAELPSFPTADVEHDLAPAPDMSLSDEFAALGFQESANVDMNSSPFESRNSGGSLDELPGFGSDTDVLDRRLPKRNDLGSSMPQFEDDRVGDPTHVERVSMNDQIGQGPEEDTPLETEHGVGELNAALASAQRNELLDMASSLESDLEGLSSALDPRARKTKVEPPPAAPPKPDNHKPNMQALNALATDGEGPEDPNFNFAEQVRAEREIGSAFEQMFGEVATDDGFGEPHTPDKAETRVYDGDALAGVEAEQAISRPAQVPNEPAEWFVAIDDQQVGPLSISDVQEKWEAGELAADSLCWKQGLGDWQPIKLTAELRVRLGDMEDRERTVVAPIGEEDSLPGTGMPPQISLPPDPAEREQPMAAAPSSSATGDVAMDEPSWRPSAASALASLAAEELSSAATQSAVVPPKNNNGSDVAVGAALPATSDALEKLLAGGGGEIAPSPFGAAEKSESAIRPLPRRAEAMSSMPLRDPTVRGEGGRGWVLPVSILSAALIVAGGVIWAVSGDKSSPGTAAVPPQTQVAAVAAPPPAAQPEVQAPPPPAAVAEQPSAKVEQPVAKAEEKDDEEDDESADSGDKEAKKKKSEKKKKEKSPPKPKGERRELVDEPPPSRPQPKGTVETDNPDDLLLPPSKRKPIADDTNEVPRQLEDGDILKVLRTNRKAIIDCVKKQNSADGSVSGTMMVNLVITKNGEPTRIAVSPDRYSKTVAGKCVTSSVKSWKFGKFSGPNMPIDFPVRIR